MGSKPKENLSKHDIPTTPESLGNSRDWGDANDHVKFEVQKEIIQQATKANLSQHNIANLLALAEVESGFNPDAATTSHISSASGVFAITDQTADDAKTRFGGNKSINGYKIEGEYDRFDPKSNISYGIAVYMDKKRLANSDDIGAIYKTWNTNADETAKYKERLQHHAVQYEKDLKNKVWDSPGPAAPPKVESVLVVKPEAAGKEVVEKMFPTPKSPLLDTGKFDFLSMPDSPSSRILQSTRETVKTDPNRPDIK